MDGEIRPPRFVVDAPRPIRRRELPADALERLAGAEAGCGVAVAATACLDRE